MPIQDWRLPWLLHAILRLLIGVQSAVCRRADIIKPYAEASPVLEPSLTRHFLLSNFDKAEARLNHILVINSSASGNSSISRMLVHDLVKNLVEERPQAKLSWRDVDEDLIPQLTSATVAGVRGVPQTDAELAARSISDELIAELRSADLIVIGAPMYNFSIPSSLRTWFDHVLRPRVTFAYSAAGPEGLLTGKRAIVVESRGGLYSDGPDKVIDFQEPYLRHLLGFIGITNVSFIHAEKIGFGPDARELALSSARKQIVETVAQLSERGSGIREGTNLSRLGGTT